MYVYVWVLSVVLGSSKRYCSFSNPAPGRCFPTTTHGAPPFSSIPKPPGLGGRFLACLSCDAAHNSTFFLLSVSASQLLSFWGFSSLSFLLYIFVFPHYLSFPLFFFLFSLFFWFSALLVSASVRDGCNPDRPRSFLFQIRTAALTAEPDMSATISSSTVRVMGHEAQPIARDNWKGRLVVVGLFVPSRLTSVQNTRQRHPGRCECELYHRQPPRGAGPPTPPLCAPTSPSLRPTYVRRGTGDDPRRAY